MPKHLALIGLLILLSGCAGLRERAVLREADAVREHRLTTADSADALAEVLNTHQKSFAKVRALALQTYCADPAHATYWNCRSAPAKGSRLPPASLNFQSCSSEACVQAAEVGDSAGLARIEVTGSRIKAVDLITNNQEYGVDEGDIVKKLGDRLFVLRYGRLHVIDIATEGQPDLQLRSTYVLSTDPDDDSKTWYDEIIAVGDRLVLLGFNWQEEVAELSLFHVQADGVLSAGPRYGLRTGDYFDGGNYGVRLAGEHLLLTLSNDVYGGNGKWPVWQRLDSADAEWSPLIRPQSIYLPLSIEQYPTLSTVLRCPLDELAEGAMDCEAQGFVGSDTTQFYASSKAAYLSMESWDVQAYLDESFYPSRFRWDTSHTGDATYLHTLIFRVPFDGSAPGVLRIRGGVGDQFAFMESEQHLFVTTDSPLASGQREVSLWQLPLSAFGAVEREFDTALTLFEVDNAHRMIRFSPDALWVGANSAVLDEDELPLAPSTLIRQPLSGSEVQRISLPQSVDRIEPINGYVFVSGLDASNTWSVSVVADRPLVKSALSTQVMPGMQPSEDRSHAFSAAPRASGWLMGMPAYSGNAYESEDAISDLVLFDFDGAILRSRGVVDMQRKVSCDQECYAWYGDARVFFVGERVFALSNGWLKELRVDGSTLAVVRDVVLDATH